MAEARRWAASRPTLGAERSLDCDAEMAGTGGGP